MSNFPIIPTTPPPLDLNENEEEEEQDEEFESFDAVSPEDEKDIDFVVPDFEQLSDSNKFDKTSIDNKERTESEEDFTEEIVNDFHYNSEIRVQEFDTENVNYMKNEIIGEAIVSTNNNIDANDNSLEPKPSSDEDCSVKNNSNFDSDKQKVTDNWVAPEVNKQEEDDFGEDFDFGDFASFNVEKSHETLDSSENKLSFYKSDISFDDCNRDAFDAKSNSQNIDSQDNGNDSDDEFADFASAQPVLNTCVQPVSSGQTITSGATEPDDEFADFSSFQENNDNKFVEYPDVVSNSCSSLPSDKFSQLFADSFPLEEPMGSIENAENISKDFFSGADSNSKNLWKNLKDLENASSLKVKWTATHCFQLLLVALNIDPRNILRNPSVPMFASGLGCVLEPTKHQTNGDFSDDGFESQTASASTSIPPVQFDWGSSGLTNPLDLNQKSVAAYDLDFFVTNDDVKNTKRHSGASNFEDLLNDKSEDNSTKESSLTEPKNDIMQQILSTANTSSVQKSGGSQVLSAEALQVLEELPDLSFMRAKVLMFPLINIKNS